MAIVLLPEGQQRSGKQGGIVWSHNKGGPYVRNRAVPTNPNTDRQVVVRNYVRGLAIGWANTLTQVQRDAWDLYAANVSWTNALGQTISLTGLNHYIRSNVPRLQCSLARIDAAPVVFNIAAAEQNLGATASEATQLVIISFDDTHEWCDENGGFQVFFMGRPVNGSIKFFGSPFRLLGCSEGDDTTPPTSPLTGIAVPNWPIAEGQRVWIRSRIGRADGRLSEFAQMNFLVAA